uniref:Uncharacterized protein n=1 Tax=Pseudomonas putida TaxID=303 RepID=A0A6B7PWR6_PSEPU|nr:hypothetical protein [Pseudomonas putida]
MLGQAHALAMLGATARTFWRFLYALHQWSSMNRAPEFSL